MLQQCGYEVTILTPMNWIEIYRRRHTLRQQLRRSPLCQEQHATFLANQLAATHTWYFPYSFTPQPAESTGCMGSFCAPVVLRTLLTLGAFSSKSPAQKNKFLDWLAVSHARRHGKPTSAPVRAMHTRSAERRSQDTRVHERSRRSHSKGPSHNHRPVCSCAERAPRQLHPRSPTEAGTEHVHLDLAALEEPTVDDKPPLPYNRVYAWWVFHVTGNTMCAKLTRSKTTGDALGTSLHDFGSWSRHPGSAEAGRF